MPVDIFDRIRERCAQVTRRAKHVRIAGDRIREYALSLPLKDVLSPGLDPRHHYLGRGEDTLAFLLILDTVNFGSGYFPHLRKRPGLSGYFTVASSLNDHFQAHGPMTPRRLVGLTQEDCAAVFGQDLDGGPRTELMGHFQRALNDLGRYVLECFDGCLAELVRAARHSAEALVYLLSEMPYFRDTAIYEELEVPFYKRAQIIPSDLALAFGGQGCGRFEDLHRLTLFADNLVPHVLRVDGVLEYDPDLAHRIDSETLIPAGSEEEVEIRAGALHAVELIARELRSHDPCVTAMQLDNLLWNRGQQPFYKARPRHRTRSVYY